MRATDVPLITDLTIAAAAMLGIAMIEPTPKPSPAPTPRLDRLERLRDHMARVEPKHFACMTSPEQTGGLVVTLWGNRRDVNDPEFVGNMGGHATAIFGAQGLGLALGDDGFYHLRFGDASDYDAAASFFGIGRADAYELFRGTEEDAGNPLKYWSKVKNYVADREGGER